VRFLLYALREYKTGERKQWGAWLLTLVSYNCRVKSRRCTTAGDGSSICDRNVGSARSAGERSNFPRRKTAIPKA